MNSKNKLIGSGCIILLLLVHHLSFGQTFTYSSAYFNIKLPSLSAQNRNQTHPLPFYTLFIEPGNGMYIKDSTHLNDEYQTSPFQILYNQNISGNPPAIMKITGHYDTIKPPKDMFAITSVSNSVSSFPSQSRLPSNKSIGFDYSDKKAVVGDTMTFVITYKPDSRSNTVIAFYYNDNNRALNGRRVFSQINNADQTYPFSVSAEDINSNTSQAIKVIRTKEETARMNVSDMPVQVQSTLSDQATGFNSAVYFTTNGALDSNERNIFISMVIPNDSSLVSFRTKFKAVLIRYKSVVTYTEPAVDSLAVDLFASDPNGITTNPHCLDHLPRGGHNQPIKYDITFENIGKGDANDVEITVWIPDGIQMPESGKFAVKSTVGRNTVSFVEWTDGIVKSPYTYKIINTLTERKIFFNMPNINLSGTGRAPRDVLKRLGFISFTLNTISEKNNNIPGAKLPECMYSDIGIVFVNHKTDGTRVRNPVFTGSDLVRRICYPDVSNPNPCPRAPVARIPPQTQ